MKTCMYTWRCRISVAIMVVAGSLWGNACVAAMVVPEIYVQALTVQEGLPDNKVDTMFQDATGLLWFGTMRDLVRYDGHHFTPYQDARGERPLLGQWIKVTEMDAQGVRWIGTNGYGLYRVTPDNAIIHYLPNEAITCVQSDGAHVLVGTTHGLRVLDPHHPEQAARYFKDQRIQALYKLSDTEWLVATNQALYVWDRVSTADPQVIHRGSVWSLASRDTRSVWVGAETGLALWVRGSQETEAWMTVDRINSMQPYRDLNGLIEPNVWWLGTNTQGLWLVDIAAKQVLYKHDLRSGEMGLANSRVYKLMYDRSHVLWATTEDGIRKLVVSGFKHVLYGQQKASWMPHPRVMAMFVDKQTGHRWVGMDDHGLVELDEDGVLVAHYEKEAKSLAHRLTNNRIRFVYKDRRGYVWVGTEQGLNRIVLNQRQVIHYFPKENGLSHAYVSTVTEVSNGELWFGTDEGGVNVWDPKTDTFRHLRAIPDNPNSLLHDTVLSLYGTRDGRYWVGTLGGLSRIERDGKTFTHYPADLAQGTGKFLRFRVRAMLEDGQRNLWLGTDGGLSKVVRIQGQDVWTHYGTAHGLDDVAITALEMDKKGRLWFSSRTGLGYFDPETQRARMFGRTDGLMLTSFSYQAHAYTAEGLLLFGGTGGFVQFNPERVLGRAFVAPLAVTGVSVSGQQVNTDRLSNLTHRDRHVRIGVSALDYRDPERNEIRYKLAGFEGEWQALRSGGDVNYPHLPAGDYVLQVKVSNSDGVWSSEELRVPLTVHPAWWATWWAYMLYGFMAVLSVGAVIARLHQRHRQKQRESARQKQEEVQRIQAEAAQREAALQAEQEDARRRQHEMVRRMDREFFAVQRGAGMELDFSIRKTLDCIRSMSSSEYVNTELEQLRQLLIVLVVDLRLDMVDSDGILEAITLQSRRYQDLKSTIRQEGDRKEDGLGPHARHVFFYVYAYLMEYVGDRTEVTVKYEEETTRLVVTGVRMNEAAWRYFELRMSAYGRVQKEGEVVEVAMRNLKPGEEEESVTHYQHEERELEEAFNFAGEEDVMRGDPPARKE